MSGSGSSVKDQVKVPEDVKIKNNDLECKPQINDGVTVFAAITDDIKIEEADPLADSDTIQQNGDEDITPALIEDEVAAAAAAAPPSDPTTAVVGPDIEDLDESTQDAEVFGFDKDSDVEEEPVEESCFKIDKVYSVAKEEAEGGGGGGGGGEKKIKTKERENSGETKKESHKTESGKPLKNEDSKKSSSNSSTKDASGKPLKPKTTTLTTLAKVPALATGVGGVRLLSGGVRGPNMPLLVSMGAGSPGIPLLPAGLPPGRYVILPGTSTTTKTTCATVNTTSASMAPRLATSVTPTPTHTAPTVAAVAAVGQATTSTTASSSSSSSSSSTTPAAANAVAAAAAAAAAAASKDTILSLAARSLTPTLQVPHRSHTRERGRRKSYTTGEKLAMIEAVEAGQRKSTVADRFGVAPSTLACILAQKNKIRAEQDNLTRRRFRHVKYMDDGRGSTSRVPTSVAPTLRPIAPTPDQPFTHFLASLTGSSPTVFDTQPEEIIAVPDLVERMEVGGGSGGGGGSSGGSGGAGGGGTSGDNDGKLEDDCDDDDGGSGVECLGTVEANGSSGDIEYRQDHAHDNNPPLFAHHPHKSRLLQNDGLEEPTSQEISERSTTPTQSTQVSGLTGPYLLKKETHCSTVLDQLLRDDTYTDVTLTAEGQSLRAHRIVLCLSSPYFRQVLSREQNVQSVVLLRDVKFAELRNIIHFIYTGEATVDASDLESFMRTAEMLEITSLSEGQKYISSRGLSQGGGAASGFSIGDFEKLVGTKRSSKESSSPPSKSRRVSGESPLSRCSSAEPTATSHPLSLIEEDPIGEPPSTSHVEKAGDEKPIINSLSANESNSVDTADVEREITGNKRKRRDSSSSIGGFAAIAGVQKASSEADDEDEVFSSSTKSHNTQCEDSNRSPDADSTAAPGRCPYCPHVSQKFEGIAMMRHLLVTHPCKPAFPCLYCWRVFVKRTNFKNHSQKCKQVY